MFYTEILINLGAAYCFPILVVKLLKFKKITVVCDRSIQCILLIVVAIATLLAITSIQFQADRWFFYVFLWFLIAVSLTDYWAGLIPNIITYPAALCFMLYQYLYSTKFYDYVVTGIIIGLIFMYIAYLTSWIGMGDGKLLIVCGIVVGSKQVLIVIMVSCLFAILHQSFKSNYNKDVFGQPFPFGPYLAVGGGIAHLYGESIVNWYLASFL